METSRGKDQKAINYGLNIRSLVPLRSEPREQAEMISQLLFGEFYQVLENHDKWLKILNGFDQYPGWMDLKYFHGISRDEYLLYADTAPIVLAAIAARVELLDSSMMMIPAGSNLYGYDHTRNTITFPQGTMRIRSFGEDLVKPGGRAIDRTARSFLNVPYLWGGRSSCGMDCSGFVQIVYKIHGICLPRDVSQQSGYGNVIGSVEEALPGDLAFFSNGKNVTHTGMITSRGEIIHCSGWVRTDAIDNSGIYNHETGNLTHHLHGLRRITGNIK
jgi:hypothetical protein